MQKQQMQVEEKPTVKVALKEPGVSPELLVLQIVSELRSSRERNWSVGGAAHALAELGYTDDAIAQEVTEQGVPVERSTINLYRLNYEFYIVKYGLDPDEMLKWTTRQVSAIRRIVGPYNVDKETLLEILRRVRGKSLRETAEIAAKAVGKKNVRESEFKNVALPTPIVERLQDFTSYLQGIVDAVGDKVLVTPTVAIEFSMEVIEAFDREVLMKLWQQAHGEASEEDFEEADDE